MAQSRPSRLFRVDPQRALLPGLLALGLAAALPSVAHADATSYLRQAQQALSKGDLKAAQIDLRNAVKADPQNGAARYELAKVAFDLGDPVAAEREARNASVRGFDPHLVVPLLGQSMLAQGKFKELLQQMTVLHKDPGVDALILVQRGYAYSGLNQLDDAAQSFAAAEKLAPNETGPLLADARLAMARGDLTTAEQKIDRALLLQPKLPAVLLAKAQLQRLKGDMVGALSVLDQAIAIDPSNVQAKLDRAAVLIATGHVDAAKKDVDAVLAATPGSVQGLYLQAVLLAQAKDYQGAELALNRISAFMPRIPRAYFLEAMVKQQLGLPEQAESAAQKYLARAPNDLAAYKLLAQIQFSMHRPLEVIATLRKVAESGHADAATLDLLGRAYALAGQPAEAADAFQRAVALAPNDVGLQTRLASVRLSLGHPDQAMSDLDHTLTLDPKNAQVGQAYFFAALATGDLAKAKAALAKVQAVQGDSPSVQNLGGLLKLSALDLPGAEKDFRAITQATPDYTPAQVNLVRVLIMEGKTPEAMKLLGAILDKAPTSEPALTMMTAQLMAANKVSDAVALLARAHDATPGDTRLAMNLADLYVRDGKPQKALDLISATEATLNKAALAPTPKDAQGQKAIVADKAQALPGTTDLMLAKANAEVALSHPDAARQTLSDLLKVNPQAMAARRQLIALLMQANDFQDARNVIQAGMAVMPRNYELEQDYVMVDLKATGIAAALSTADQLQQEDRDFIAARALKGDVYMAANRPEDAAKAYQEAQDASPNALFVTRLSGALERAGHPDEAEAKLVDWVQAHPADLNVAGILANLYIANNQLDKAVPVLKTVLAAKPHDPVALNNLAWIYGEQKNPAAEDLARQAYILSPGPQTADTLGWILVSNGKPETGVALLRQAASENPTDPRVQYHFAVALNDTGSKAEAAKLLSGVVASKADFPERAAAEKLLHTLNKG
ncbi:MAG: PEP-CTERM system TPR-repeat protein PrsT [Rhodospirillales bacterium]|nr:PEP-CTERM system TPR-repeat protein PrsT [Rhodospirillales bacterium]